MGEGRGARVFPGLIDRGLKRRAPQTLIASYSVNKSGKICLGVVWMHLNFKQSSIWAASLSSRLVLSAAFFLLAFFVVGGSEAATLYCRQLQSYRSDGTVYARRWVTLANGGNGGREGDYKVYPFLADCNYSSSGGNFYYWPKSFSSSEASPILYTVKAVSSLNISNLPGDKIDNVASAIGDRFFNFDESAAISAIGVTFDPESGDPIINVTTYSLGRKLGSGVVTMDHDGHRKVSYADSTGFVPGYIQNTDGSFRQVWYDIHSTGNYALMLDSLNNISTQSLQYDDSTGQYSFVQPDYGPQLSAINESIQRISFDNITLEVPTPEVNVSVSPPAVTVNPEITVTPTVTVPAPEVTVNVDSDYSEIVNTLDQLVEGEYSSFVTNDFSDISLSQEEQDLLNTATGWQTQIPLIGEAFDLGLNILVGKIPQMDKSYSLLNLELWGYQVRCDLSEYRETIMLFRAFFLLCELVWFFWVLWHDIMNALKV